MSDLAPPVSAPKMSCQPSSLAECVSCSGSSQIDSSPDTELVTISFTPSGSSCPSIGFGPAIFKPLNIKRYYLVEPASCKRTDEGDVSEIDPKASYQVEIADSHNYASENQDVMCYSYDKKDGYKATRVTVSRPIVQHADGVPSAVTFADNAGEEHLLGSCDVRDAGWEAFEYIGDIDSTSTKSVTTPDGTFKSLNTEGNRLWLHVRKLPKDGRGKVLIPSCTGTTAEFWRSIPQVPGPELS